MASNTSDDFLLIPHNGAYGNKSNDNRKYANLAQTTAAAGDTFDFVKIPAGAQVIEGFLFSTQMTGTSTWSMGVRYADGTSTGGTTGTAVMAISTLAAGRMQLVFQPFMNDSDTICYATHVSGPAHTANDNVTMSLDYQAKGTR